MKRMLYFFLALLCSVNFIFAQKGNSTMPPKVEIGGTQLLKLHSDIVDQDYDLYINLPRNYSDTTRTFPVIFLLDAQYDFPLVTGIYGEQYYDGFLPDMVTVGITWGGDNPNYEILRIRDFSTIKLPQTPESGNGAKFLSFIENELIPFIESEYRVSKKDRTLMGTSAGGFFTLYTLFNKTELFNRYVLTSPALPWGDGITYKYEKDYAEKNSQLPVKLYMAIGGYEDVETFQKFVEIIKSRNYKGLEFQTRVLEGTGHSATKPEGYSRGLQYVFMRPSIKVDEVILKQYVGTYDIAPGFQVKLTLEDHQLIAVAPGSGKLIMDAETESDFYMKGRYLYAHFKKDDTGKVIGFQLVQFNGQMFCKKTD